MAERDDLLESIATTIADYREGEIEQPTPEHVDRWVRQFDREHRLPILREMNHVLPKTYVSNAQMKDFILDLVRNDELVGKTPKRLWRRTVFLDLQTAGTSQQHALSLMNDALQRELGFGISECGGEPRRYVYIDDSLFTGNRIKNDLISWITTLPRETAVQLHVICYVLHTGGHHYANQGIEAAAATRGVRLKSHWWRALEFEDQLISINNSDVLRPSALPEDDDVRAYVEAMHYKPVFRSADGVGSKKLFSSGTGRVLLEQEFLRAGVQIRKLAPQLNQYQRPLGNSVLETLGFGTMFATYRNCPNNAPLALWAGDPWYPLLPRRTNAPVHIDLDFDYD